MNITAKLMVAAAMSLGCISGARALEMEWVTVGDPGNVDDTHGIGFGGVDYIYDIGKYEVTNAQYCEFLNAVAADDPNGLYNIDMGLGWEGIGGIMRIGAAGNYSYWVRLNRGNRPVNYVSWYDALRFANWLHNGQPTGPQGDSTTEDGAYDMSLGADVVRKPGARVFLPSEDEAYKAAYYKGGGTDAGYWDYPTQSDTVPTAELPPGTDLVNGSVNYYIIGYVDPIYYTTEVGAYTYKPSASAYGTFNQGGNLFEWNEGLIGWNRGLLGGSFYNNDDFVRADVRYSHSSEREEHYVGFRVARVRRPAADFDGDGDVDLYDLARWQRAFTGSR